MDTEYELELMDVVCQTEGCENAGITITVQADPINPAVVCGPCGKWIIRPEVV